MDRPQGPGPLDVPCRTRRSRSVAPRFGIEIRRPGYGQLPAGGIAMKVIELRNPFGLDSLTLAERPDPCPGPGQVLLKMHAWSLNYRDLLVVQGLYNPKLRLPILPLSDGV